MNEKQIFEALDKARAGLRECLEDFESSAPNDPKVGRSFSDVQDAFEILGNLSELKHKVSEEAQVKLRKHLEDLLRVNALLSNTVRNDREKLINMLHQSQRGLKTINALTDTEPDSPTCDFSA
ncbi:MAG: hypothetical protein ACI9X4_002120 [Glaciecola sp.]